MRKIALTMAALATLGLAATGCSSTYSRDETIDNLVNDAGLTEEQATCVVDKLEDEVGTEKLNEVVNEDPENPPADVAEAMANAYIDCLQFDE